ncbi:hypothetical protein DS843_19565 [Roseomonas genomospecies 6]|uniref:Uncharacterized protein n=1 Tax=Roseomonas genomospecies 6 TaxID=214106 RepID=A0A9W7NHB9_9PROT|nr:hypothetical protein DS843_19565 [Roseomonas genomospecies 6]
MPTRACTGQPRPTLHCACCGRPFTRASGRGPAPLYCSADCRVQMRIRQRVWANRPGYAPVHPEPRFEAACAS